MPPFVFSEHPVFCQCFLGPDSAFGGLQVTSAPLQSISMDNKA